MECIRNSPLTGHKPNNFLCLEYKNNLLKENALMKAQPKVIDLDKGMPTLSQVNHLESPLFIPNPGFVLFPAEIQKFSK